MHCPQCGADVPNGAQFCPSCGTPVSQQQAQATVPPPSPAPPAPAYPSASTPAPQPTTALPPYAAPAAPAPGVAPAIPQPTSAMPAAPAAPTVPPVPGASPAAAPAPQPATPKAPVQITPQQLGAFGTSVGIGIAATLVMSLLGMLIAWGSTQSAISTIGIDSDEMELNFFHRLGIFLANGVAGATAITVGDADSTLATGQISLPLSWIGYALLIGCAFGAFMMARKAAVRFRWVGVVSSFAVGAVSGLVVLLLAAIMRYNYAADDGFFTVSGATFRTFAMAFLLATAGALIGYFLADTTADESNVFTAAWTWAHRVRGFRRTIVESAACYIVVSTVIALIFLIVLTSRTGSDASTPSVWAFLPLALPAVSAYSVVLGSFGALEMGLGSQTVSLSVFGSGSMPVYNESWMLWISFVLYLLCACYVALRAAARNAYDPYYADWKYSWQAPVFWLAFWLATPYLFMAFQSSAASVSTRIVPALWFCLIAALWSFIIEALGRLLGPTVIQSLPGIWPILVGGTVRPGLRTTRHDPNEVVVTESVTMTTPNGTATGYATEAFAVPQPGMPAGPQTPGIAPAVAAPAVAVAKHPMSKKTKMWLIIGGVAVGLVIVLSIVFSVLNSTTYSASATAKRYIAAIESGDFDGANGIAKPQVKHDQMALMSNKAAPKDGRISNAQVIKEKANGNAKTVTISYTIDGKETTRDLKMIKRGSKALVFTEWGVAEPMTTTITVAKPKSVTALAVNGVEVNEKNTKSSTDNTWSFTVYPGTYTVSAGKSKYLTSKNAEIIANGEDSASSQSATLTVEATDALTDAIQQKVNAKLDECAKSTDFSPKGCPFSVYTYGDKKNFRNFTWSISDYPEVDVDTDYGTFETEYGEEVKYTYEEKNSDGWEPEDGETTMSSMSGTFNVDGDKVTIELNESDD